MSWASSLSTPDWESQAPTGTGRGTAGSRSSMAGLSWPWGKQRASPAASASLCSPMATQPPRVVPPAEKPGGSDHFGDRQDAEVSSQHRAGSPWVGSVTCAQVGANSSPAPSISSNVAACSETPAKESSPQAAPAIISSCSRAWPTGVWIRVSGPCFWERMRTQQLRVTKPVPAHFHL